MIGSDYMNNVIITFEDDTKREYFKGIKLGEIIKDVAPNREIICGSLDNVILNHNDTINHNGKLFLYDLSTSNGSKMYEKGFIYKGLFLYILLLSIL